MASVDFEKLLQEYNQAYVESAAYSKWMPPEGEYIVVVTKVDKGVTTQEDGSSLMWWSLTGDIVEEGTYKGRSFLLGYFTNKGFGFMKSATEALSGKPAQNLAEADEILTNAISNVLRVKIEETYSKKYGKTFTNATIESVLPSETV